MITYKNSGVDISAGKETVDRIKPLVRRTFTPQVLTEIGMFGAMYDARFPEYEHPVLVSSADGVGTKLKIAFMTGKHSTVGQCLVNHCTNDILACGAKPLFFLDYFATGKLEPLIAEKVISGLAIACSQNNCALIGGETAEMPSMYSAGEYDIAGTIVGVVEKSLALNSSNVQSGNVLIGLESNGLHTNGYSLARNVLFPKFAIDSDPVGLGESLGEYLLRIHTSYLHASLPLIADKKLNVISHITGGGIEGNTSRVIPSGVNLIIDWESWERPAIFDFIQREGDVPEDDMRATFNLGIGMIAIVDESNVDHVVACYSQYKPKIIGRVDKS